MFYKLFVWILFVILLLILLLIYLSKSKLNENFINHDTPVYVSVTSIYKNQEQLYLTLNAIKNQSLKPNRIYVYLSEDKSFFDNGFSNKKITNTKLNKLIKNNNLFEVIWGKDIGPHGKLLPLLKEKWNEDCIIITIDDDTIYYQHLIKNLVSDYKKHKCVISYRGFTPKMNKLEDFGYKIRNKLKNKSLYNFGTGKGGVLYKPEFFKKTKKLIFDDKIYKKTCDKQDDIWFYIVRVLNNVDCYLDSKKWVQNDISTNGLYNHFNSRNNNNTKAYHKTLNMIKKKSSWIK